MVRLNSATTSVAEYMSLGLLTAAQAEQWKPNGLPDCGRGDGAGTPCGDDTGPGWRAVLADPTLPVTPEHVRLAPKSRFVGGGVQRAGMGKIPEIVAHLSGYPAEDRDELLFDLEHGVGVRDLDPEYRARMTDPARRHSTVGRRFKNAQVVEDHLPFALTEIMSKMNRGVVRCLGTIAHCRGAGTLPAEVHSSTIEPGKPRWCLDARRVNDRTRSRPGTLEGLGVVRNYIVSGSREQVLLDETSAYSNDGVTPDLQDFLGFVLFGYIFVYVTLPFGWKLAGWCVPTAPATLCSLVRRCCRLITLLGAR